MANRIPDVGKGVIVLLFQHNEWHHPFAKGTFLSRDNEKDTCEVIIRGYRIKPTIGAKVVLRKKNTSGGKHKHDIKHIVAGEITAIKGTDVNGERIVTISYKYIGG